MELAGPASLYTWQLQEGEQLGAAAVRQPPRKRFQQLLHSFFYIKVRKRKKRGRCAQKRVIIGLKSKLRDVHNICNVLTLLAAVTFYSLER
jgi:hypothetical protein